MHISRESLPTYDVCGGTVWRGMSFDGNDIPPESLYFSQSLDLCTLSIVTSLWDGWRGQSLKEIAIHDYSILREGL